MPSHILPSSQTKPKPLHRKTIKKGSKIARQPIKSPSNCDSTDENTMTDIVQILPEEPSPDTAKQVLHLLKFAILRFKYSIDTYLVALTMLQLLKFQIPQPKIKLMASAILLIAAKVHQFRTPKFVQLVQWGEHEFGSGDLITAQADILSKFDFRVPVVLQQSSLRGVEIEVMRMEAQLLRNNFQ